jgi:DNA-binding CsgD family transcriptional regulator
MDMQASEQLDFSGAEAADFAEVLEGICAGMVLIDARGRITHANAAGRAMLADGAIVSIVGRGLLAFANRGIASHLRDTIASTVRGDIAVGTAVIAVPLNTRNGERYVIHALPLTSGLRDRHRAVAALFIHQATLAAPSLPEIIAKSYSLTPAELRVLLAVVDVGGVSEVAEALGISATTVKTHLGRLYGKTGTRRQADLVKLVAGFSSPIRHWRAGLPTAHPSIEHMPRRVSCRRRPRSGWSRDRDVQYSLRNNLATGRRDFARDDRSGFTVGCTEPMAPA